MRAFYAQVTSDELAEWNAFLAIEPFALRPERLLEALIEISANQWRAKLTRPIRRRDLLPTPWEHHLDRLSAEALRQDVESADEIEEG